MATSSDPPSGNMTPRALPVPMQALSEDQDRFLRSWVHSNTFSYTDYSMATLAATVKKKGLRVTVIIPGKEVAPFIASVLSESVKPLIDNKVVHNVYVIDADSKDGTGAVAAQNGATVLQRAQIAPEFGASKGKGDAMWRALLATSPSEDVGEIVAFMDGDTGDPHTAHLIGTIGPLIENDNIQMVRGFFERPFKFGSGQVRAGEGGRVTELAARPLLNLHFPELAGFQQPLAGFFAGRRQLLEKLAFPVGYGIEIGSLIDSWRLVGLAALAQSDLGTWQNDHKLLRDLTSMAFVIANTVESRRQDRLTATEVPNKLYLPWTGQYAVVPTDERPPIASYKRQQRTSEIDVHMALPSPPFLTVDGVSNFRDIGGYPTFDGAIVKRNVIYRSADLTGLTDSGLNTLKRLRVSQIFDLRSQDEVRRATPSSGEGLTIAWSAEAGGVTRRLVPVFNDQDYTPEVIATRFRDYANEGTEGFERAYDSILRNAGPVLATLFDELSKPNPNVPILIHCSAGKDRTGIVIMVLLLLAGCSADDIAHDYALTEEGLGPVWRATAVERLSHHPAFEGQDRSGIERMVGARKEVMLAVIKNLEREWGIVEQYLMSIGIAQDKVDACRDFLRETP